jgi:large subunit ribosomal protein L10
VQTRENKEQTVLELNEKLGRASSVFVADYKGLTVKDLDELRQKMRESDGCEYQVVRNTLLRRAAEGNGAGLLKDHFSGPTAIAISYGDPVGLAKVLVDYAGDHDAFEIKGAELDGQALGPDEVAHLATLPSLQELRGTLAGLLLAPASKIARLLKEPGGQLARLVAARKDKLEE